jgi:hypothetical protein
MSSRNDEAEAAVLDWMIARWGISREEALDRFRFGLPKNHFADAEPELRALIVRYKNTLGRSMEGPPALSPD